MFNQNARWDRPLRREEEAQTEPVTVVAGFKPARQLLESTLVRPLYFVRPGQEMTRIEKVNYAWVVRKGRKKLHYFSVSAGANVFCLSLDPEFLTWNLLLDNQF